jgi:hypothetical protein
VESATTIISGNLSATLTLFYSEGQLVPTPEEVAQQQAQRADRLAEKLRELNIDPDNI